MTVLGEQFQTAAFTHSTVTSVGWVGVRGMALGDWPVRPNKIKDKPKSQSSLDVEYSALCDGSKAWDMAGVKEWFDV